MAAAAAVAVELILDVCAACGGGDSARWGGDPVGEVNFEKLLAAVVFV